MKKFKTLRLLTCFAVIFAMACGFSGCSFGPAAAKDNLDLSEMRVIENSPNSGQWNVYTFDCYKYTADTAEYLRAAASQIGYDSLDPEKVLYSVRIDNFPTYKDIPLGDMGKKNYALTHFVRYVTDDFFIVIDDDGRINYNNFGSIRATGVPERRFEHVDFWGVFPYVDWEIVKRVNVSDSEGLDLKYDLDGKQTSIADALAYAEGFLNSKQMPNVCPSVFEFVPTGMAIVYEHQNGKNGYYFDFRPTCDGVHMNVTSNDSYDLKLNMYMITNSSIDLLTNCRFFAGEPSSVSPCEVKVDLEKALQIVSKSLGGEHKYKITRAELMYLADNESGGDKLVLRPTWQIIVTNTFSEKAFLWINIDAEKGTIIGDYWA